MIKRYLIIFFLTFSAIVSHAQWTALSGPPGATVQDLERTSGGTLYMISSQKLFQSINNGDTWSTVAVVTPFNLTLDDLIIDSNNKMYGVSSSNVYTSTDGGLNWTKVSMNGQFYGMSNIMKFGPDNMLAIYGWNGMYVSSDDGINWIKIHTTEIAHAVASSSGTLFAGSILEGIKRYTYPGLTGPWNTGGWTLVNALPTEQSFGLYYDDAASIVYASLNNTNDVVWSTNNGTNWSSIKAGVITENIYQGKWAKSPDGKIFLANYYGKVYYTPNTGTACGGLPCISWTTISNAPIDTYGTYITEIVFQDANTVYLGTQGDAVFKTTNVLAAPASVTWTQKAQGLNFGNGTQVEIASTGGRILYLNNTSAKGYWTSTNGGTTWSFIAMPEPVRNILKLTDGNLLMYSSQGVYRATSLDGLAFSEVSIGGLYKIVQSPGNGYLYASGGGNALLTSTDNGTNWIVNALTGMPINFYLEENLGIDNNNDVYTSIWDYTESKRKIYKITGTAGTQVTNIPWDDTRYVNNVFVSNNKVYVCQNNAIFESSDGGSTWRTISFSGDYVFPISGGICVSRGGNPGSLYVTQDGGLSWNSTSLPAGVGGSSYITDLAVDAAGDFIASAYNSPALKFTADLVVDPGTLPPFIDFNWQPTNGPYGGNATEIFKNTTNNVFGLVNGDVYKTPAFLSWQNLTSGNAPYLNDLLFVADNTIYGLTYDGLYSSPDGGNTWSSVNNETSIFGRNKMVRLANGNIAFYSSKDGGEVYVSSSAGPIFTFGIPKYELNNETYSELVNTSDKIFLCIYDITLGKRELIRFDDNGANPTVVTLPVTLTSLLNISVYANNLYVWGDVKELYKSIDNGASWTDLTGDLTQNIDFYSKVYTSPTNELFIMGSNKRLYKSINNGTNWTAVGTAFNSTVYDIIWVGTRMVFATNDGVFTSDDGGVTIIFNSTGIAGLYVEKLDLTGPNKLYAKTSNDKQFASNDLQNWAGFDTYSFGGFIDMPDGSILAYTCDEFFKSTNDGESWIKQGDFNSSNCIGELVTPDGVNFYDKQYSKIFYTNNLTSAWTELNISGLPPDNQRALNSLAVDGNGVGYIVLYNSQNSTNELYQVLFGSAIKLSLSTTTPVNVQFHDGKIIVFFNNGSIFETTDGSLWTGKGAPSGNKLIIANNNYYFIPQSGGTLWLSRNTGQTWQNVGLSTSTQNSSFTDIIVNEYNGYAYGSMSYSPVLKSANIIIPDDTTPPSIVSVTPADNATGVDPVANLTISFSEPIIPQAAKTLRIIDATNIMTPVETINVTAGIINGKTITFNPTTTLQYLKSYFIVFDAGSFKDIFGNAHAGNPGSQTFWNFTIQVAPDTEAPSIVSLTPTDNAIGVNPTTNLTLTFNEPITPQEAKTLRIVDAANTVTPVETINVTTGTINGNSITFNPSTTLEYLKSYFIEFDAGAFKDIPGNSHAGILDNSTWSFTVQDNPDPQAPSIIYTQVNFTKGQSNALAITVSDNAGGSGVSASTVKLFYRGIMSSAAATEVTIPNTNGSTYQISVPDVWMDELGLEFYFTAADMAGNPVRSPAGTAYHTARIAHTETNHPNIPASFVGVGGKATDYKMFSIPFDLQSGSVNFIFNELGAVDNTQWRIVQYITSSTSYSDATSISRGTGYWINTKTAPSAISVEGATTPNDTKASEFQMALKTGWNLIGNPYPFAISWTTVKAANANIGDVKTYNGSFNTDNTLSPFEAGFVLLNGDNLTVTIPFSAKTGGRMHDPQSFSEGWLLPLTIENGELKNDLGGVGMHKEAEISYDQFDDASLPRLFEIPELHFNHPEHFMKKFTRDIVPVQDDFEWRFSADVQEGSESILGWSYDLLGEFDKELFLLDESRQVLVNMMEQDRYSFLAAKSQTFKLYYGADLKSKIKPTSITLGKPYPNPTQSNSSISFTLPENVTGKYNVVLDVYDLVGNKITTLANGQLSPGFHSRQWNPEQHQMSSGLYIYKLMVIDNSNKKILTEKIIIQK